MNILLAEDDALSRDMLSRRLARRGHRVSVAVDGIDAMRQARELAHELLLLDLAMPGASGWEVLRVLRTEGYTRPIIVLSAHAMYLDRSESLRLGANDYLTKPVDFARLEQSISALSTPATQVSPGSSGNGSRFDGA